PKTLAPISLNSYHHQQRHFLFTDFRLHIDPIRPKICPILLLNRPALPLLVFPCRFFLSRCNDEADNGAPSPNSSLNANQNPHRPTRADKAPEAIPALAQCAA